MLGKERKKEDRWGILETVPKYNTAVLNHLLRFYNHRFLVSLYFLRSIHNSLLAVFAHDLYSDVAQTHNPFNRERYCLQVTASLLPTVTSNLYLTTFPPDVDKALRQQVNWF